MVFRGIVFSLTLFALSPFGISAQSENTDRITLLLGITRRGEASGSIELFMRRAALLEFNRLGFPAESVDIDEGEGDAVGQLLERAEDSEVPYGCILSYSIEDELLSVYLELLLFPANRALAERSFSRSLDLSVDRAISENIRSLVRDAGIIPPEQLDETDTAEGDTLQEELETEEEREPAETKQRRRVFETAVWFGPFLPNGGSAGIIPFGLFSEVTADFRIKLKAGHLGVGLHSGFQYMGADGVLTDAVVFLIPLGVDVKYVLGGEGRLSLFLGASGGAATMIVQTRVRDTVMSFMPYAQANIGTGIAVSPGFGFAFKVSYAVYFESGGPIFGLLPSGSVYFRF